MIAYTDYPFLETDQPYKEAPIREIEPIFYDGDKYLTFLYEGKEYTIKSGYVYSNAKRIEKAKIFDVKKLKLKTTI